MPTLDTPGARPRLDGLDLLRGLVMVIMALDHARDWFSPTLTAGGQFLQPESLDDPPLALFLTRWVTHFCAPVFVFLAGVGAWLHGSRPGRTPAQVSRFLATRGLWLILLEVTVVFFAWDFQIGQGFLFIQVLWAIGASFVLLALLCHLPRSLVLALGLLLVCGHNLLDGTTLEAQAWAQRSPPYDSGPPGGGLQLYMLLHVPGLVFLPGLGTATWVGYPLLPWLGVLCVGWGAGPLFQRAAEERGRLCARLGLGMIAAFLVLRGSNLYGNPTPWAPGDTLSSSVVSFLNVLKYPPSLAYLLMTLGPSLALMPLWERLASGAGRPLVTIGRVPLLYYVAHLYLLHGLQALVTWARYGREGLGWGLFSGGYASDYPLALWVTYLAWALAVLALYPLCRWFAGVKARSNAWWLSYL